MMRIACLAFGLAALSATASAQVAARAGGHLVAAGRDWLSVGRLDIAGRSFCTVTLIAPDRALTAAHCLTDERSGALHAAADLTVQLGLREGRAEVTRGVVAALPVDPGLAAQMRNHDRTVDLVPRDLAVLVLDRAVRLPHVPPVALGWQAPQPAQALTVVSYARGRAERAAIQDDCLLIAERQDGALILDCQVDHGSSGAPVIAPGADGPSIVAVVSARARMRQDGFPDADVALAAPVTGTAAEALGAILDAPAPRRAGVRLRRAGAEAAEPAGGARRVRVAGRP